VALDALDRLKLVRRFPPPWSVDDPDPKLDRQCFIVRDANGHALAYVSRTSRGGGQRRIS
jgi:hypothetical protein